MTDILADSQQFIANINRGFDELHIDRSLLTEMDHLCYRVETNERYHELLDELSQTTELVGETFVGGRPIATFRLTKPVTAGGWKVSYIELPAPKEGSPYSEGLEHAELVVLGGDLERFLQAHSHLDDVFLYKGMSKTLNPELGLKANGISVKFHKLPLGEIVRLEKLLESEQSA